MPDLKMANRGDSRILVVDDNAMNVLFMKKLLSRAGYTNVETCTEPDQVHGLTLFFKPDLIILDLHMPGMSGYEILEQLRSDKESKGYLPVLVFTADATGDARRRALELGATDFLTKPGDPSEITLRVHNFLEMRHLYRQLENYTSELEERVRERTIRLQEAQLEIVYRLALAGDYRDDQTGDHCRRVGDLSWQLALEWGMSSEEANLLRLAAPLHDIGKVAIPDGLLNKKGKLSETEFEQIKQHTHLGAAILADSQCEILQMAHTVALTHHERWDGRGYAGMAADEIPLVGRIVAVADVYDALTHERPYKKAWPESEAIAEIVRCSGTQFDPTVVEAFVRVMKARNVLAA